MMRKELRLEIPKFYKVKEGQTLEEIAATFRLPPALLVFENALKSEVGAGEVLKIPEPNGNLYTVQAGDTKLLLSGGEENFRRKNGTDLLYPEMKVFL